MIRIKYISVLIGMAILMAFRSEPTTEKADLTRLEYDIIVMNRSVGDFVAERSQVRGRVDYKLSSEISVWLFKPMSFTYDLSAQFEEDVLVKASLCNRMNENLRAKSSVQLDGDHYETNTKDGKVIEYERSRVEYSAANLFFEEPGKRTSLFSENYGVDLAIEKVADHRYKLTLPNGDYNFYDYENGHVKTVEMHRKLAVVKLRVK